MRKALKVGGTMAGVAAAAGAAMLALNGTASDGAPGRALAAGGAELAGDARADPASVVVWKTPTCGCCAAWVDHMREAGFEVEIRHVDDRELILVKRRESVPVELRSCHTAVVDGYALEGHVPAEDVRRLLAEDPDVRGLAVPGMPVGSPGMEMGDRRDAYEVVAFDEDGGSRVFSSHP